MRIGLVLPDVMGTYGDGGNSVVLRQRLRLRGFDAEIIEITLSDPVPSTLDLYTLGGAEDYAQRLATRHLIRYPGLQEAAARGAPVLAICAAIQVLGHWYETSSGERVDGVGLLDVTTSPQPRADHRRSGVPTADRPGSPTRLTGFENHRGGTVLGAEAQPLAKVISGAGNREGDGIDGAVQGSVVATYLHGPCLARNPAAGRPPAVARRRRAGAAGARRGRPAAPRTPCRPPPRLGHPVSPKRTNGRESASESRHFVDLGASSAKPRLICRGQNLGFLVFGDHADDFPATLSNLRMPSRCP